MHFKNALKKVETGVIILLDVTPGAKKTEFVGYNQWRKAINIKVKAQAKEGKANKELIKFLKDTFKANVEIISGSTSPQKSVLIKKDFEYVMKTLKELLK